MWFGNISTLVTVKHGLAVDCCFAASPHSFNSEWAALAPKQCPRPAPSSRWRRCRCGWCCRRRCRRLSEHSGAGGGVCDRWRRRRRPSHSLPVAGMAQGRSHTYQQSVEEQDGQRHQEAIGQCRSVHNAGATDRPDHRGDRLLAVRQLLVPRPRGSRDHRGLTQAGPESRRLNHRRHLGFRRLVTIDDVILRFGHDGVATLQSGQRLAIGRRIHEQRRRRRR